MLIKRLGNFSFGLLAACVGFVGVASFPLGPEASYERIEKRVTIKGPVFSHEAAGKTVCGSPGLCKVRGVVWNRLACIRNSRNDF